MQDLILYTQDAPAEIPQDRIQGWMLIARGKVKMDNILQGHKLLIDQLLTKVSKYPGPCNLEEDISEYRKIQSAMVADRKKFTSVLDYVKDATMAIEKEYDPKLNAQYSAMEYRHLEWKKLEQNRQQAAMLKDQEINALKAHVINEYHKQAAAYRQGIRELIHICYTSCLKARTPKENTQEAINTCVGACTAIRPSNPAPFQNVIITTEELQAIAQQIPMPNWKEIWDELMKELVEKFHLYSNDLAAAEVVIAQSTIDMQHVQAMENQALQNQIATNNLVAQGAVYIADKVEVKVKKEIKMNDEDPLFVMKIMSAFISNFQNCMPLLTVKKYSALNIKQMAAALDKAQIQVMDVEYLTIEK